MRQLSYILIALVIVAVYADEPDQLVNGIPTDIKENPHCVSLRINNNHFCGGSIIDKQYILTAAHCLVSLQQNPYLKAVVTVVAGTTYLNSGGQVYKIQQFWIHENYDPNFPSGRGPYDIGLIKLTTPIQFGPTVQSVMLPKKNIEKDDSVTIAAWGSTGFRKPIHNGLQKLTAKAMLADVCQQYHKNFMPIHQYEFCTLITYGTGLCNGDSGSGLIRNSDRTIVGLVSGGRPCAVGFPDVYTSVQPYCPWIEQKMRY